MQQGPSSDSAIVLAPCRRYLALRAVPFLGLAVLGIGHGLTERGGALAVGWISFGVGAGVAVLSIRRWQQAPGGRREAAAQPECPPGSTTESPTRTLLRSFLAPPRALVFIAATVIALVWGMGRPGALFIGGVGGVSCAFGLILVLTWARC